MQWRLHLLIQISLALFFLGSQQWFLNRLQEQGLNDIKAQAFDTADGLINGLNLLMVTGKISDPSNRTLLVKKMADSSHIVELRVVRAPQVSAQFGPGLPEEQPADDDEWRVLATGKPVFRELSNQDGHVLRAVIPYIVSKNFRGTNCLMCHHVALGSVNGAADISLDLSGSDARIAHMKRVIWAGAVAFQVALSILIALFVNIILKRNIVHPVQKLQDVMQHIHQNGDLSMRAEVSGKHPDVDEMARTFNLFVHNLELATKSITLLAKVVENSEEAIIISDADNRIIFTNEAFSRLTGYTREEAMGQNPRLLKSGKQDKHFYKSMWDSINTHGRWQGEIWNRRKSGEIYPEWQSISTVKNDKGEIANYVSIFMDITKHKEAEAYIHHMANFDQLTGLANRNLLDDRLSQVIFHAQRHNSTLAVMFLDLDNFKDINDGLGHAIGDQLLKSVAERLVSCVREDDTVARQGGDEFIIVLSEISDADNLVVIAKKLIQSLSAPFCFDGQEVFISVSIGIASYPSDGTDKDVLLKNADAAMYCAKENGRNCFRFYTAELNEAASRKLEIQNGLRYAIERNELVLHYQPQLNLETGEITGLEALVRWQNPEKGLIAPNLFIPVAEESGLIVQMGQWILLTACTDAKRWHDKGLKVSMSVNVSGRQFKESNFVSSVARALLMSGFDAEYLELELTESILINQQESISNALSSLKSMGVKLALDDFGTGYSSLSYLKHFPLDRIKIDQSFVRDVLTDHEDAAIVNTIISLANGLGLEVIAEGVETEEQLVFLGEHHCKNIQGYYLSRPKPGDEITDFLESFKFDRYRH